MPNSVRFLFSLCLLFLNPLNGADYIINWGTDAGPNSPNYDALSASPWTNNPSPVQLLKDFSGAALTDTTGGPDSSWSKGDLIELGFFC